MPRVTHLRDSRQRDRFGAGLKVERLPFETGSKAAQPSVAVDPREGFVISWQERRGDGSALHYAVLDRSGKEQRRGLVSSGPERFINGADFSSLAVLDNGDWVTFWLQKTAAGTYAYEIHVVRSRDRGRSWDAPVVVHRDATPTEYGFVSMAPAGADRVRLIWLDGRNMAGSADAHGHGGDEHTTLLSAVLTRDGVPTHERELDALTCACCQADLVRGAQKTVAVYRDRSDKDIHDVGAVVLDDEGASPPYSVHDDAWTMPGCPVDGPALAAHGERFLVIWPTMADGSMDVRAALGNGDSFDAPRTLGKGADELRRVDAADFAGGWLVSRVTTQDDTPTLTVTRLTADGEARADQHLAGAAGGYPRLTVIGDVALTVFTQPSGGGTARSPWSAPRSSPPPIILLCV